MRCDRRSLNRILSGTMGVPTVVSILLYVKVSVLGFLFVGAPFVFGLEYLGLPQTGARVLLIFFALLSFTFFGWGFYVAPQRQLFQVCELGLVSRHGLGFRKRRWLFDHVESIKMGDTSASNPMLRVRRRRMLVIHRNEGKPIKLLNFTVYFQERSVGELIELLHTVSGVKVGVGDMDFST